MSANNTSGPSTDTPEFNLPSYKPLDLSKATVCLTGASSGIGLELVRLFLRHNVKAIVGVGRSVDSLNKAKQSLGAEYQSKFHLFQADVGKEAEREALLKHIQTNFPETNILINNAGIQRRVPESKESASWSERHEEIAINFEAPIHLVHLFIPHLLKQTNSGSAIMNVSSGLAFVGSAFCPVYAATKAAIHAYTIELRYSLAESSCQVYECIPPAVKSNLGGSHDFGEDTDVFCAAVFDRMMLRGEPEVGYQMSETSRKATRQQLQNMFDRMSNQTRVPQF